MEDHGMYFEWRFNIISRIGEIGHGSLTERRRDPFETSKREEQRKHSIKLPTWSRQCPRQFMS